MNYRLKNAIFSLLLAMAVLGVWYFRESGRGIYQEQNKVEFTGETMGTYYLVKYLDEDKRNFQPRVDSILALFNQSLSTYIPGSEISVFNRTDTFYFDLPYFLPVLKRSREVYEKTGGAFDPTVMPLVNAWGFGPEQRQWPDSARIDSLLQFVGFEKVAFDEEKVYKKSPGVQLDFSAVAKGYGVDVVADYLMQRGVDNLMVEIGGEVYCKGKNQNGDLWRIGVNTPVAGESGDLFAILPLNDQAVATSGNYRNFYTRGGQTIAHTISPFTGYPVAHSLLSASVVAPDCMTADAYATAFMALGMQQSREILEANPQLEGYLIYKNENDSLAAFMTPGVAEMLESAGSKAQ